MFKKFFDTKTAWAFEWLVRVVMLLATLAAALFIIFSVAVGVAAAFGSVGLYRAQIETPIRNSTLEKYQRLDAKQDAWQKQHNYLYDKWNVCEERLQKCQRKKKCK